MFSTATPGGRRLSSGTGAVAACLLLLCAGAASGTDFTSRDGGPGEGRMLGRGDGGLPGMAPEWVGLAIAFGGLVYLVSPGLSAPVPVGSTLMAAASPCEHPATAPGRARVTSADVYSLDE